MDEGKEARLLSDAELAPLSAILNEIIPASDDGRLPAAGALGMAGFVSAAVGADPELTQLFRVGLTFLGGVVRGFGFAELTELAADDRVRVLEATAKKQPDFFRALVGLTCMGYYQDADVVEALGLESRAPFPQGYAMPASNPTLLDPVRAMPRRCRDA